MIRKKDIEEICRKTNLSEKEVERRIKMLEEINSKPLLQNIDTVYPSRFKGVGFSDGS